MNDNDNMITSIRKLDKWKDLIDLNATDVRCSIIVALIVTVLFFACYCKNGIEDSIRLYTELVKDICIAYVGLIGFIITGLALLTGAISSRVVNFIYKRQKKEALQRILLSFCLLGIVIAIVIISGLIVWIMGQLQMETCIIIDALIVFILGYMVAFSLFYSVKLIGNCLALFNIVNDIEIHEEESSELQDKYNRYRLIALESLYFVPNNEDLIKYKNKIEKMIKEDALSDNERAALLKMFNAHFMVDK